MSAENLLFFRRNTYALPESAILRVANLDHEMRQHTLDLQDLGLLPDEDQAPVRVLFVSVGPRPLSLIVRGPLLTRRIGAEGIIRLPSAFFGSSVFEALVRHESDRLSLLLAPERLVASRSDSMPPAPAMLLTRSNCEPS